MENYQFNDPAVRPVKESDVPCIIELFELNYGDRHPHPELYEERWVKNAVHGDNIIWLLIEEKGEVVASGSLELDYGDYNDQLGLIGRLVTRPGWASGGLGGGLGSRMINALASEAEDNVECVISNARTAHRASQKYLKDANLIAAGFLPHHTVVSEKRENLVLYANLYDTGRMLRSMKLPQVISEVAPLADCVLSAMNLPATLDIINSCLPYPDKYSCDLLPADRRSLAQLRRIERGQLSEPLIFDSVSLDYNWPVLKRKKINYLMGVNKQEPVGAVGYRVDTVNQVCKLTGLAYDRAEIINHLCAKAVDEAEQQGVRAIEVDLSAYDARIQQTFLNYGFHPVAYVPAMVFHNTCRLDIVKMMKLEVTYDPVDMRISKDAKGVVSVVERGFTGLPVQPL